MTCTSDMIVFRYNQKTGQELSVSTILLDGWFFKKCVHCKRFDWIWIFLQIYCTYTTPWWIWMSTTKTWKTDAAIDVLNNVKLWMEQNKCWHSDIAPVVLTVSKHWLRLFSNWKIYIFVENCWHWNQEVKWVLNIDEHQ